MVLGDSGVTADEVVDGRPQPAAGHRRTERPWPRWIAPMRWPPLSSAGTRPSTGCRPASAPWPTATSPRPSGPPCRSGLVRSHAATVGDEVEREVVRAMMLLRAATLAKGFSGSPARAGPRPGRPAQRRDHAGRARARVARLQRRPGAAGPRGPGPHRRRRGHRRGRPAGRGRGGLSAAGIAPAGARGQGRAGPHQRHRRHARHLCLAVRRHRAAAAHRRVAAAMSVEALLGTDQAFRPELAALRPHPGQAASAANMLAVLAGSGSWRSHQRDDTRVQDAYSLRCAPQVIGAGRDTLDHARIGGRPRAGQRHRQPGGAPRRAGGVVRQLPRRAARLCGRLPRHRPGRPGVDRRTADRPPARPGPLPRAAAVPGRRPGRRLRADAGPVQRRPPWWPIAAGWPSRPAPTASPPRPCRRTTCRWAGPRPASCAGSIDNATRVVAIEVMTAARALELRRAARAGGRPPPPWSRACGRSRAGPGPDRFLAPEIDRTVRPGPVRPDPGLDRSR